MQPASDMILGWTGDQHGHDYFVRLLRDIKINVRVQTFRTAEMDLYASWCGRALALSRALGLVGGTLWIHGKERYVR